MTLYTRLRERFAAMPLDPVPLRRAGLLTVLLVVLVVGMQFMGPARPARSARQSLQTTTETSSVAASSSVRAPRPRSGGMSFGRVAFMLLLAGGGIAVMVHRRKATPAEAPAKALEVLETFTLGQGQALRLVACGHEVLLLSVATDGIKMLRSWTRAEFERGEASIAEALAAPALEPVAPAAFADVLSALSETPAEAPVRRAEPAAEMPEPVAAPFAAEPVVAPVVPPAARGSLFPIAESPVAAPAPVFVAAPVAVASEVSAPAVAEAPREDARTADAPPSQFGATPAFSDVLRQFQFGHA